MIGSSAPGVSGRRFPPYGGASRPVSIVVSYKTPCAGPRTVEIGRDPAPENPHTHVWGQVTRMFDGFPKAGLTFLAQLARNNDREWFNARKEVFEREVKAPMFELVAAVNDALQSFAPEYVNEPKKAIARLHRDTRFSKDKSPYRTEMSAVFPFRGAEKETAAGYWFSVSPKGVDLIAGSYMPGTEQLANVRAYLDEHHAAFRKLTSAAPLKKAFGDLRGERLQRVPRGFDPDHPAADLLRLKQYYFQASMPATLATSRSLPKELANRFKAAAPFVRQLDAILR